MKKTIGIRSALLLAVIVLFAAALCLIFQTTSEVAVAEVYVNFLEYGGSLHSFKAGVRYDGEITSLSEAEDFKIVLYEQYTARTSIPYWTLPAHGSKDIILSRKAIVAGTESNMSSVSIRSCRR